MLIFRLFFKQPGVFKICAQFSECRSKINPRTNAFIHYHAKTATGKAFAEIVKKIAGRERAK